MGQSTIHATLNMKLVAIIANVLLASAHGHENEIEWTITGKPFELCIAPGEHVDFLWEGGHNIVKVNQDVYDDCSDLEAKSVNTQPEAGPFKLTAPRSREPIISCAGLAATVS